jgi:hypothetical protein
MKIRCLTPNFEYGTGGNLVTSQRWRELLKDMGHDFQITSDPKPEACDLLIALHARKNAVGIRRMAKQFPHVPIVVVLTGTDLYHDIAGNILWIWQNGSLSYNPTGFTLCLMNIKRKRLQSYNLPSLQQFY